MRHVPGAGDGIPGADRQGADAHPSHPPRPSRQDIRDALGLRFPESGLGIPRRQAHRVGQLHHEQGARDTVAFFLGDDLRVRTFGLLRGVRRPRQHLFDIQPEDERGQREGECGEPSTAGSCRPARF